MIHFFPIFSREAAASPLGTTLRALGLPHRILAGEVRLAHRSRAGLLLVGLPRLALFALRAALRSLLLERPRPDVVVLGSDVEVLVFALVARLLGRRPRVALLGFILTGRAHPLHERLHRLYYRLVLAQTDLVLCHSRLEVARYARLFPGRRFAHVPWGTDVPMLAHAARPPEAPGRVLSAGRSGRDYPTLLRAGAGRPWDLVVVCDSLDPLPGEATGAVRVLRHHHGDDYLREVLAAAVVAVPLLVDDISAGQMVMIQAMACGRPLVVTDTPTTREYVTDGVEALLVPLGDAPALAAAVDRLLADAPLRGRLGRAGEVAFRERFSTESSVRHMVRELATLLPAGAAA